MYTVTQVAKLAGVSVKTLHHYHKIGLLEPTTRTESGYRLYGQAELERLQQILFYRELQFSLNDIREALDKGARAQVLKQQRGLLSARVGQFQKLIGTIDDTLGAEGEVMDAERMFRGFNAEEWKEALAEQASYLKETYGHDILAKPLDVARMNEAAAEAQRFLFSLVKALREDVPVKDNAVQTLLADHLAFLRTHGHAMDAQEFVAQARFFIEDDFHRKTLEAMQVGLAYYHLAAVQVYAGTLDKPEC